MIILLFLTPMIKPTMWAGPGEPITYKEWRLANPSTYFTIGNVSTARAGPIVDIIVNATIYDSIIPDLQVLKGDIESSGYVVQIDTATFENTIYGAIGLKNHLKSIDDLAGAILIGDLPVPWYQMFDEFYGLRQWYEEFPIDLFYMDLDGTWLDSLKYEGGYLVPGSDSIFDTHYGDCGPEIWVSRLTTSTLGGEIQLIKDYIDKSHRYRTGQLLLPDSALVYVDDDWEAWAVIWSNAVGLAYPNRTLVCHPETTNATDYRTRLKVGYEWNGVHAHSSPSLHAFRTSGGNTYFYASEIPSLDPDCSFYNLFACSNARYVESGYMGGRYVFNTTYGVGGLGSTKTGSMLEFQDFYRPLGQGECLGDAFANWFDIWGEAWGDTSRSWFYGMTLLGDGSLTIKDTMIHVAEQVPVDLKPRILPSHIRHWSEVRDLGCYQIFDDCGRLHHDGPKVPGIYFLKREGRVYAVIKI